MYVQDGGVRETLESIFIPPVVNAPFTCTLQTEWARAMPDGGTMTLVNQRRIARETSGRFYQERWVLVPKNGAIESKMSHIQITDPNAHTLYTCTMGLNVCEITPYGGATTKVYKPTEFQTGPIPDGTGYVTREALGTGRTLGVDTVGTRITRTINAWAMGNDRPVSMIREFWFAPTLGISLLSKISDPRFGSQTFTISDLTLGDPDPRLFEVPEGFHVQDKRPSKQPEK